MASTIKLKNGSGAPLAGDLVQGEPALDLTNKRLYTEDSGGNVIEVGVNPAAEIVANAGIALPDNQKATFGASDDLQIYHDGSNSYISDTGTGNLNILANEFALYEGNGTDLMIGATPNGAVTLSYNASTKLATTSTGIDVTGAVTADGLTVDGSAVLAGTVTATAGYLFGGTSSYLYEGSSDTVNLRVGADGPFMQLGNDLGSDAAGMGNISGDLALYAGTEKVRITSSGNVGIGTNLPSAKLEVNGTLYLGGRTTTHAFKTPDWQIYNTSGNALAFNNYTSDLVTITSAGNVGIGTSSPATALDVVGTATADHFKHGNVTTTATSKTIVAGEFCNVTAATQTITLPATTSAGDTVKIGVNNFTDTTVARNGSNIMSLAENLTIDKANVLLTLTYVDSTIGWRIY